MTPRQLGRALRKILDHPAGAGGLLRDGEIQLGARLLPVGTTDPILLPVDDWDPGTIVSALENEIRLVALLARRPGTGAMRRLVEAIKARGLVPVVVAPMGSTMPAIMRHWGWRKTIVGPAHDKVDEWRP